MLLSYVSLLVNALVSFAYVPILLGSLTAREYGVYELIGSMIAYLGVMDMGLSTTLSRFLVFTRETEESGAISRLLGTSAMVYALITLLSLVVCGVLGIALGPLLGGSFSADEMLLARSMMGLVALNCLVVLPGNWFLAIVNAHEDFAFVRIVSIARYLLQVTSVLLVLQWHAGAFGVLVCQVVANVAGVACYAWYARKKYSLQIRFGIWDRGVARRLFSFSFFVLLNMVFDQVFWKTGQVVLAATCGAAAVAVYGVVCKVITVAYMQVSVGLTSVFLPKLTELAARGNAVREINELFVRIGRLQAVLVWGLCGGFLVLGREFIELWAGPDFAEAYAAIVVLMFGLSICLVQNLGISVLQAKNKMAFRSVVYVVIAVIDVAVSIPVSGEYGVIGCAVVAAALLFVGTGPIMNWYYARHVDIDVRAFFKGVLPLAVPVAITCAVMGAVLLLVSAEHSWQGLIVKSAAFVLVDAFFSWQFFLNDYEKGLVRELCARAGSRMGKAVKHAARR